MHEADLESIDAIRAASRTIVRELGFMRPTLAGTRLAPSAVQAILEIGGEPGLTAATLAARLDLEKSSVSRLLGKLVASGEILETVGPDDARVKALALTRRGRQTFRAIEAFGSHQVRAALDALSPAERRVIGRGLVAYARALAAFRSGRPLRPRTAARGRAGGSSS